MLACLAPLWPCGQDLKVDTVSEGEQGRVGNFRQQKVRIVTLVFSEQLLGETDLHLRAECEEASISETRHSDTNQMLLPACSVQLLLETS